MSRPAQIRFLSHTARLYDPTVRALGFPRLWNAIAAQADPSPGQPCLDVCTGTGGVALALASRGASVVGVDLAPGMLERARSKARAAGLGASTRFLRMDARKLALPDAGFPIVTCCMALHEMADREREAVLAELRRVAAGRVLVAEYRVPPTGWRRQAFRLGRIFEYLESDNFAGFLAGDFRERLVAAGFAVDAPSDAGAYRVWRCHAMG